MIGDNIINFFFFLMATILTLMHVTSWFRPCSPLSYITVLLLSSDQLTCLPVERCKQVQISKAFCCSCHNIVGTGVVQVYQLVIHLLNNIPIFLDSDVCVFLCCAFSLAVLCECAGCFTHGLTQSSSATCIDINDILINSLHNSCSLPSFLCKFSHVQLELQPN